MKNAKLSTKLYLLLGMCMVVGIGTSAILFHRIGATLEQYERLINEEVRQQGLARDIQVPFRVQIQEWKSDTFSGTSLEYGVALFVFDATGVEIGRTAINGNDVLGGQFTDPAGHAEKVVPDAHARKLEALLNAPAIRRALAAPTAAPSEQLPAAPPAPPTEPAVRPTPPTL